MPIAMVALQNFTWPDLRHPKASGLRAESAVSVVSLLLPYAPESSCRKRSRSERLPARHSGRRDAARDPHPGFVPASGLGARHLEQLPEPS
jgi:hypothetical protein